ncbi:MAG: hypothetical protein ACRDFB_07190, partial [Rhabdochlamydiaceae bacterium]
INTKGLSSNTLKLYDGINNTGTLIGTIDTTEAGDPPREYNVMVKLGIFAIMNTGTAADVTIVWD